MEMISTQSSSKKKVAASVAALFTVLLLFTFRPVLGNEHERSSINGEGENILLMSRGTTEIHRKLLGGKESGRIELDRIRGGDNCSNSDIIVSQSPTSSMPHGIPTFSVEILNNCFTGCNISGIHLKCGWFSSVNLINPKIFKRLKFDDCLVNDGKPLLNGSLINFKYSTTRLFPLSVSSVICG
ncbi:protein TAPETUM DETERMINANT 1 isoform X1 [Cannabis sativa]|nr:protein TAPETUM DETERMINANT 1 isoform X1 [Cannabis sativa]